jgi:hypothetical protein
LIINFGVKYSSNNRPRECCKSDKFIDRLDKKAELYFSGKKKWGRQKLIVNGLQFINKEAFLAFRNYIAENDLVEVCMTPLFHVPYFHYHHRIFISHYF